MLATRFVSLAFASARARGLLAASIALAAWVACADDGATTGPGGANNAPDASIDEDSATTSASADSEATRALDATASPAQDGVAHLPAEGSTAPLPDGSKGIAAEEWNESGDDAPFTRERRRSLAVVHRRALVLYGRGDAGLLPQLSARLDFGQ
jgi:hypothetical protein